MSSLEFNTGNLLPVCHESSTLKLHLKNKKADAQQTTSAFYILTLKKTVKLLCLDKVLR